MFRVPRSATSRPMPNWRPRRPPVMRAAALAGAAAVAHALLGGMLFGVPWMVAIAPQPAAIGRAIDAGIVARPRRAGALVTLVIAGLGVAISLLAAACVTLRGAQLVPRRLPVQPDRRPRRFRAQARR